MSSDFPPSATDVCFDELEIASTSAEAVINCADSNEGANLLHELGVETHGLDPKLTFVPWTLFNNVFDEDLWRESMVDLKKVICDNFLPDSNAC